MLKRFCFLLAVCLQTLILNAEPTFIVGAQNDNLVSNSHDRAALWITDTSGASPKTIILGNENDFNSIANAITAIGDKLFCAGEQYDGSNYKATLWITDISGSSPTTINLGNEDDFNSSADAITAIGNKLYIAGQQNDGSNKKATLWITDISGSSPTTINLGNEDDFNSSANAITAIDNKLYIAGQQNDGLNWKATLWITDISGSSPTAINLEKEGNFYSNAYAITAIGNKLYIAGQQNDGSNNKATLWITDISGSSPTAINLGKKGNFYSGAYAITAIGNQLFCAGEQYDGSFDDKATLWITDISGSSPTAINLGETIYYSGAYGITSSGKFLYSVGEQDTETTYNATLWITDTSGGALPPITIGNPRSYANGIYIPQPTSQVKTFLDAIYKFSPNHFQKGL